MLSSSGQDLLHPVFLAHVPFAQELDLHAVLGRQPLGVLPQLVAEWLSETRIIENLDLAFVQVRGHTPGEADLRQRPEYQHPVPATQLAPDLLGVTFG
jgi:hypothetical protein